MISCRLVCRLPRRLPSTWCSQGSSADEATSSPTGAFSELGAEDEPTSSSSIAVPGLLPLAYAVTSAVALVYAPLIANVFT